jgi:hypothetical protein
VGHGGSDFSLSLVPSLRNSENLLYYLHEPRLLRGHRRISRSVRICAYLCLKFICNCEPTQFPLNGVIKGWTEGVQLMVAGEKRRFWIPAELAYGPVVPGRGRPGGLLVFDIELLEIVR